MPRVQATYLVTLTEFNDGLFSLCLYSQLHRKSLVDRRAHRAALNTPRASRGILRAPGLSVNKVNVGSCDGQGTWWSTGGRRPAGISGRERKSACESWRGARCLQKPLAASAGVTAQLHLGSSYIGSGFPAALQESRQDNTPDAPPCALFGRWSQPRLDSDANSTRQLRPEIDQLLLLYQNQFNT